MELRFNIQGAERKALVTAVSEITNQPPQYLGAPSFAYRVGDYHIDKNGTLTGDCTPEFLSGLEQRGYTPPIEEHAASRVVEEHAASRVVDAQERVEADTLTIELPKKDMTGVSLANLEKLLASKAGLIKKALSIETLTVEQTDETLKFPWFTADLPQDELTAYSSFLIKLCEAARTQTRVTAKEREVDNEKYAFRCFLLRLGFIGNEYKDARKILLAKLSGDNSYKNRENRRRRADMYGRETENQQNGGENQ